VDLNDGNQVDLHHGNSMDLYRGNWVDLIGGNTAANNSENLKLAINKFVHTA
jgi:hypothetical protein